MKRLFALLLCNASMIGVGLAWSHPALASSGVIAGQMTFTNLNGGYCPSGQTCTGAKYIEAQYGQTTGVPKALVALYTSAGALVNVVQTDNGGVYSMPWSIAGTGNQVGIVALYFVDASLRYRFAGVHATYQNDSLLVAGAVTLTNGTTSASPQSVPGAVGNNPVAQAFWAAWKAWQSLSVSSVQNTYNTNVDILAFDDATASVTGCTTSCAKPHYKTAPNRKPWAGQKMTIALDGLATTPFDPQARMMHELGHVADYVGAPNQGRAQHPGIEYGGTNGHDFDSQEYKTVSNSEGLAHFFAATALYSPSNTDPRICSTDGSRMDATYRTCWGANAYKPNSLENAGACSSGDGRKELNTARYFWDIYDSVGDANDTFGGSILSVSDYAEPLAPCPGYPACYASGQLHDAWLTIPAQMDLDNQVGSLTDADNNGTVWFRGLVDTANGINTYPLLVQNCLFW